jgi:single-strand DNA-binding protein
MADLKMPELNNVVIAGNLTKDPVFRQTTNGTPVVNFSIASNRKYRDSSNQWLEDVCYVGIVAWNRLAESCRTRLKKGDAVLVDGELQSRTWKTNDGFNRSVVEIKARRIQFLNKKGRVSEVAPEEGREAPHHEEEQTVIEDDSFDKFLTKEESALLNPNASKPEL